VENLRNLTARAARPKHSAFKAYEPGYLHIDAKYLPQMADESRRRYLFVAMGRATRWVFIRILPAKTAADARRFLRDLERACPIRIRTILTDSGKELTDRLFGLRKRVATGEPEFDTLCTALEVKHRLTPPKSPQTNGMVERVNGRIEEVLQSHHFGSGEELENTLQGYAWPHNRRLLIIGAMSRIISRVRHKVPAQSWIGRILERKPKMLVGIGLVTVTFRFLNSIMRPFVRMPGGFSRRAMSDVGVDYRSH
jgi:transposase InsO family protein